MPGWGEAGSAGRCGPSVLGNTHAVTRVMRLPQGRGSHPGHFCPAGKPPAGEAREGSAGVCSGRNRASIDLLLLKPELLSGTLQPGCPRMCFLERAILRAFASGGRSPQSTWPRHWPTPGSGGSWGTGGSRGDGSWGVNSVLGAHLSAAQRLSAPRHPRPSSVRPAPPVLPTGLRAAPSPRSGC